MATRTSLPTDVADTLADNLRSGVMLPAEVRNITWHDYKVRLVSRDREGVLEEVVGLREGALSGRRERDPCDLASRQSVARCCAIVANSVTPKPLAETMVAEMLAGAAMTSPKDFEGCNEAHVERIHAMNLSCRGIFVKEAEASPAEKTDEMSA